MQKQYFGTDGIRGNVGNHPITPDFIMHLGWAIGRFLKEQANSTPRVLIGKDTRLSGYMIESALEAGLAAAGCDVELVGPMPTPAIAYLTRTFRADIGVVVSASHNPFEDNGIKLFSRDGFKLPDEAELAIESYLEQPLVVVESEKFGKARRLPDAASRYIEFCKNSVVLGFDLTGMRIVLDCANGATYEVAPKVFRELGAQVITLADHPNGMNINQGCGSTQLAFLQSQVSQHQADLGIAFDGDGDRVMMVDETGNCVDGDELLLIIVDYYIKQGYTLDGVVGTLMSNLGLEQAIQARNLKFIRAKVGDRYVLSQLLQNKWLLGGESSGHIVCLDRTTTGDGIISALQALCAVQQEAKPLSQLKKKMHQYPQMLYNVSIAQKLDGEKQQTLEQVQQRYNEELQSQGRVLLRPSGTEPVVRVMVEAQNQQELTAIQKTVVEEVQQLLT